MEHATVKIGEHIIPLIGIPPSATDLECEFCYNIFHITDVHLNREGTHFLCKECRKRNHELYMS